MNCPLNLGDLLRCPRCRRWHPTIRWHTQGTPYVLRMLYVRCNGQMFYAGQEGLKGRHEAKHATRYTDRVNCHCAEGWICEQHPDRPWPHGDCAGPGMPCDNPDCPSWNGPEPAALDPSNWTNRVSVRR